MTDFEIAYLAIPIIGLIVLAPFTKKRIKRWANKRT